MNDEKAMSSRHKNCMIWSRNREWYYIDEERDRFVLTDKASEEARRSFEEYKRINSRRYKNQHKTSSDIQNAIGTLRSAFLIGQQNLSRHYAGGVKMLGKINFNFITDSLFNIALRTIRGFRAKSPYLYQHTLITFTFNA